MNAVRQEFASDTETFGIGSRLKLGPGQVRAVDCSGQSTPISVTEDRRVQDVDRFVVEAFENRARNIFVRVEHECDWPRLPVGLVPALRVTEDPLGFTMVDAPFGGRVVWIMNCAPRVETMSRMSMCHQSALTVKPLIHFGLYTIP